MRRALDRLARERAERALVRRQGCGAPTASPAARRSEHVDRGDRRAVAAPRAAERRARVSAGAGAVRRAFNSWTGCRRLARGGARRSAALGGGAAPPLRATSGERVGQRGRGPRDGAAPAAPRDAPRASRRAGSGGGRGSACGRRAGGRPPSRWRRGRVAALSIRLGFRLRLRSRLSSTIARSARGLRRVVRAGGASHRHRRAAAALGAAMMHLGLRAAINAWSVCLVASRSRRRRCSRGPQIYAHLRPPAMGAAQPRAHGDARARPRSRGAGGARRSCDGARDARGSRGAGARDGSGAWRGGGRARSTRASLAWSLYAERRLDAAERAKAADTLRCGLGAELGARATHLLRCAASRGGGWRGSKRRRCSGGGARRRRRLLAPSGRRPPPRSIGGAETPRAARARLGASSARLCGALTAAPRLSARARAAAYGCPAVGGHGQTPPRRRVARWSASLCAGCASSCPRNVLVDEARRNAPRLAAVRGAVEEWRAGGVRRAVAHPLPSPVQAAERARGGGCAPREGAGAAGASAVGAA